jgi:AraC-like DNA-binding protein
MPTLHWIGAVPVPWPESLPHNHDCWEIVIYTHGKGEVTVGDQVLAFAPGTIICLPPVIPHFEKSPGGFRNIYLGSTDLPFDPLGPVPVFQDSADRPFFNLATVLLHEFHLKQANWQLISKDLFDLLMVYLERWRSDARAHPMVERLKAALIENLQDPGFDVAAAIARLPITADHVRKLFLASTEQTPLRYLTSLRLEQAKRLLAMGGYSVKEVAVRSGFADPLYFSRLFKRSLGVSPSEFLDSPSTAGKKASGKRRPR